MSNTQKQKKATAIQLPEENAHIASAMLHYLYTATYTYPPTYHTLSSPLPPSMLFHLHLYTLADTLVITPLKTLAQSNFQTSVTKEWSTPTFPETIKRVYEITNSEDQLRGIVVKTAAEHGKELMETGGAFGIMMGEVAEFGRDVFQVMMGGPGAIEVARVVEKEMMVGYKCPVCPFEFFAKAIGRSEIACSGCGVVSQEGEWRGEKIEEVSVEEAVDENEELIGYENNGPENKVEWNTMRANGECMKDTEAVVETPEAEPQESVSNDETAVHEEVLKTNEAGREKTIDHINESKEVGMDPIPERATEVVVETEKNAHERADSANGDGIAGSVEAKESAGEVEDLWVPPKKKKGKKGKKGTTFAGTPPTSPRATEAQIMGWGY